jgi:hypothetical protein
MIWSLIIMRKRPSKGKDYGFYKVYFDERRGRRC